MSRRRALAVLVACIAVDGTGRVMVTGSTNLADGHWHRVAAVFDRDGYLTLYADGQLEGTSSYTLVDIGDVSSSNKVYIGSQNGAGVYFEGHIDEVQVHNRILTADELTYPYASSWAYDGLDNMREKDGKTYLYQDPGHVHAVTTAGGSGYAYDANGNMTSRHPEPVEGPGMTLVWNEENLLAEIKNATTLNTIESYVYDGDKQRAIKTDASGYTTLYVNKWYEVRLDPSGEVDQEVVHYWLGGQLVATREGGGLRFVHTDHLGSSSVATDVSGNAVAGSTYYPYGEHRSSTGAFGTDRDYTGQRLDIGTGLHFYNARYYDSTLGRFISPDSIVPNPRDPKMHNRYSYVLNNPLRYTDPTGHCGETDKAGLGWAQQWECSRYSWAGSEDLYDALTLEGAGGSVIDDPVIRAVDWVKETTGNVVNAVKEGHQTASEAQVMMLEEGFMMDVTGYPVANPSTVGACASGSGGTSPAGGGGSGCAYVSSASGEAFTTVTTEGGIQAGTGATFGVEIVLSTAKGAEEIEGQSSYVSLSYRFINVWFARGEDGTLSAALGIGRKSSPSFFQAGEQDTQIYQRFRIGDE